MDINPGLKARAIERGNGYSNGQKVKSITALSGRAFGTTGATDFLLRGKAH